MLVFDMFKVTSMILMTLNMSNTNMPLNLLSISDSLKKKISITVLIVGYQLQSLIASKYMIMLNHYHVNLV